MNWLSRIITKESKNWFFAQIPPDQTPDKAVSKAIAKNEEYVHVFLKSMRIVNVRKGLSRFYPTVHSHMELGHLSGDPAIFNFVSTPGTLEALDDANVDKIININRRLLGPVPYRGGGIKMEIGLFSIKEDNLAEPYIRLLTSISDLGGVSVLSMALPYLKPLQEGIELLTGSPGNSNLEIGLTKEFDVLTTGYYVVMRADKSDVDLSNLKINSNDFGLVDKNGDSIKDYPYLVIQISSSPSRDEYYNIPEISVIFNQLQSELRNGKLNDAKITLPTLKRTLFTSPDLLLKDAKVIYSSIEADANAVLKENDTAVIESESIEADADVVHRKIKTAVNEPERPLAREFALDESLKYTRIQGNSRSSKNLRELSDYMGMK